MCYFKNNNNTLRRWQQWQPQWYRFSNFPKAHEKKKKGRE